MKVLCTFPGKYGDLLWALPTLRAISRRIGAPVDLLVPAAYASILPLLQQQPYLDTVWQQSSWQVQDTAPASPRVPPNMPEGYDTILHLGYTDWPKRPLPYETLDTCNGYYLYTRDLFPQLQDSELDLSTPWITVPPRRPVIDIAVGFTDEHFELKYGLVQLLNRALPNEFWTVGKNPRWQDEAGMGGCTWERCAQLIQGANVFLGCNSALHVLAVAVGTPVVLMEPNSHRHHPIFYPLGQHSPQVRLVKGNDGCPTWDSRHTRELLEAVLAERGGETR